MNFASMGNPDIMNTISITLVLQDIFTLVRLSLYTWEVVHMSVETIL